MKALKIIVLVAIIVVAVLIVVFILPRVLISSWISEFTGSQTELVETQTSESITCSYGNINMKDLNFQISASELSGTLQNIGQIPLGKISLNINYQDGTSKKIGLCESSSNAVACSSPDLSIDTEKEKTFKVETGRSDLSSVKVTTNCSAVTDTLELENIIIS